MNLRGETLQNMAGQFGLESTLASLTDFLDTPEGSALGTVNISDARNIPAEALRYRRLVMKLVAVLKASWLLAIGIATRATKLRPSWMNWNR